MPDAAMVLAAGPGSRMRPLTEATAKTLLPLMGRPLLDHVLDRLADAGVGRVVVNAHWHADRVAASLAGRARPRTSLRREAALLDTGGAVKAALAELAGDTLLVVHGDSFWLDGPTPTLRRLAAAFDPSRMDALLLVARTAAIRAEVGLGDFVLDPEGRVRRRRPAEVAPYVFAGVQIARASLFAAGPDGAFPADTVWDAAIAEQRLFALVHDGLWFPLSTPADLAEAEFVLSAGVVGSST